MLKIGDKDAKGLYYGSSTVAKAFLGSTQVWPSLPYDAEVQWLQSTGTQWIDTGTLLQETDRIDCTFALLSYNNNALFGGRVSSVSNSMTVWAYTINENSMRFDMIGKNGTSGSIISGSRPVLRQTYLVTKIGKRNFIYSTEINSNNIVPPYTPQYTCYLFALNNGGTASFIGNLRVSRFSIEGKQDLIPVRFTNENGQSEGAMYDKVSKQLFRNKGTGSFVIGPDIKSSTRMLIDVTTSLKPTDKYWIYPQISSTTLDTQTYRAALQALGWSVDVPSDHIYEMALGDNIQVLSSSSPYEDGWFYGYPNLSAANLNKATTAVGRLDYGTFGACSALVKLELGKNLSAIGAGMFRNCSSLKTLKIPSSVKSIGDTFIENCSSLERLSLAEGLERIEDYAFGYGNTSLKSVELPSTLEYLGIVSINAETSRVFFNSDQPETSQTPDTTPFQSDDYEMELYAKPNTSWNIPIPGTWYNQYINWRTDGETGVLDTNGKLSASVELPSAGGMLNLSFYKNHEYVPVNANNATIDGRRANGSNLGWTYFYIGEGTGTETKTVSVNQPTTIDVENIYTRNRNLIPFKVGMTNTIYLSSFVKPGLYWKPYQLSTITQYTLSTASGIDPTVYQIEYQDDQTINGTYRYYPTGNINDTQFYICPAIGSPYFVENQPWIHFPDFGEIDQIQFNETGALMTPTFRLPSGSATVALLSTTTRLDRKDAINQNFTLEIRRN